MGKAFSKFSQLKAFDSLETLSARQYHTSFPSHYHETYNISLVYEGVFKASINGKQLFAEPGSILITNPYEIHANPCDDNDSISFFTFYISPSFLQTATGQQPFFSTNVITDAGLFAVLHQLAAQLDSKNMNAYFEQQFKTALQQLSQTHAVHAEAQPVKGITTSLFNTFLAQQQPDKFSLDAAAQQFGINKFKFLRLFKQQTGLTPANYFLLQRIEAAKKLLREDGDMLGIAVELGFYDIPHFANHFKKFTGISPAAYSTAYHQQDNTV
ncbi:MAG: AraC family transcriptional regulator [Bacteroidetes bacterium]|nr:AraC family transcriptional regulator [Bacteroidota bacterium]